MALISAKTIITSLSLFHLTLGFFFLTSPRTVAEQTLVYVVGESMGMPYTRSFETQSGPLAFLAVAIALIGICDLSTLSMPEEVCLFQHWATQAPLRFVIFLALLAYCFLFGPSSPLFATNNPRGRLAHPTSHAHNPDYSPSTWGGDGLKNRVIFTWAFLEMVSWFWVFVTLREERTQSRARRARGRSESYAK